MLWMKRECSVNATRKVVILLASKFLVVSDSGEKVESCKGKEEAVRFAKGEVLEYEDVHIYVLAAEVIQPSSPRPEPVVTWFKK